MAPIVFSWLLFLISCYFLLRLVSSPFFFNNSSTKEKRRKENDVERIRAGRRKEEYSIAA